MFVYPWPLITIQHIQGAVKEGVVWPEPEKDQRSFRVVHGGADGARRLRLHINILALATARARKYFQPPVGHSKPQLWQHPRQLGCSLN